MGFGIVNTTLMAVYERMHEFGIMKAMGMKPWWVIQEVLAESFYILLLGLLIGNTLGIATSMIVAHWGINLSALAAGSQYWGIPQMLYPALSMQDLLVANGVVFILGLLVSVYPAAKAARFTPAEAMASL